MFFCFCLCFSFFYEHGISEPGIGLIVATAFRNRWSKCKRVPENTFFSHTHIDLAATDPAIEISRLMRLGCRLILLEAIPVLLGQIFFTKQTFGVVAVPSRCPGLDVTQQSKEARQRRVDINDRLLWWVMQMYAACLPVRSLSILPCCNDKVLVPANPPSVHRLSTVS